MPVYASATRIGWASWPSSAAARRGRERTALATATASSGRSWLSIRPEQLARTSTAGMMPAAIRSRLNTRVVSAGQASAGEASRACGATLMVVTDPGRTRPLWAASDWRSRWPQVDPVDGQQHVSAAGRQTCGQTAGGLESPGGVFAGVYYDV